VIEKESQFARKAFLKLKDVFQRIKFLKINSEKEDFSFVKKFKKVY
jgi:hypothetical protein